MNLPDQVICPLNANEDDPYDYFTSEPTEVTYSTFSDLHVQFPVKKPFAGVELTCFLHTR